MNIVFRDSATRHQPGEEHFCFTAAAGQAARQLQPLIGALDSHTSEPRPEY
jgi:hypothetical protein